jgi:hypothetical protein
MLSLCHFFLLFPFLLNSCKITKDDQTRSCAHHAKKHGNGEQKNQLLANILSFIGQYLLDLLEMIQPPEKTKMERAETGKDYLYYFLPTLITLISLTTLFVTVASGQYSQYVRKITGPYKEELIQVLAALHSIGPADLIYLYNSVTTATSKYTIGLAAKCLVGEPGRCSPLLVLNLIFSSFLSLHPKRIYVVKMERSIPFVLA